MFQSKIDYSFLLISFQSSFMSSFIIDIDIMSIMKNDAIDNTIFSTILHARKKNNRADTDSNYKQIIKTIDFEDVTKEFLDGRIHTLTNDEKMIHKRNCNTN